MRTFQVIICALLASVSGCSARACKKSNEAPVHEVVQTPNLTFRSVEAPSSECPHASSTRSGRVIPVPRAYRGLASVAPIDDGVFPKYITRFLDIPLHWDGIILERTGEYEGAYEVRSQSGVLAVTGGMPSNGAHLVARDEGYYAVGRLAGWLDRDPSWSGGPMNQGAELLACAVRGGEVRTVVAAVAGQIADHAAYPDVTWAELVPGHGAPTPHGAWQFSADEPGVGAIDGEGHTLIALPSGRFLVLLADGNGRGKPVVTLDAAIERNATDLSVVPPYAMILYGGGDAGFLAARRSESYASTRIDARRPDGSLAWRTSLPYLATQPAIDGNGRVYLVGAGITALDLDGRVLWSSLSGVPLRGQAFADGTLAIVRGSELQIVASDGAIKQSFRAAEELTSYPAIAADGSVWVASAKTLYVAR